MMPVFDSTVTKRQEVGRGLRLCVDQTGDRFDTGPEVHSVNQLTVVASESYQDFTAALQKEIRESLSARPRKADVAYFTGKTIQAADGPLKISEEMARKIQHYLIKNDYVEFNEEVTAG